MKVLIIGCGYVGKALAALWLSKGCFVGATTRDPLKTEELSSHVSKTHVLTSPNDIQKLISEYDTILFSVAADNRDAYQNTYLENANLIQEALAKTSDKKQIIYTSSTSVYGDHSGSWVDEASELLGNEILINTEKVLLSCRDCGHKVCVFRLGEITGPERELLDRLRRMQGIVFPGDGLSYTNFSPLDLIVAGIERAVEQGLSGVFNLCNNVHVLRKNLYDELCEKHGLKKIVWDPEKSSTHAGNKRVNSNKYEES